MPADDCVFCKILAGELPGDVVAENELAFAFADINPATRGHTLVIPRTHVADVHEIAAADLAACALLAKDIADRGQRTTTLLIYLNDDFEGGDTAFPELGLTFRGRTGDALLFHNLDAAGAPDLRTRHAGLPPTKGEKWLFSQWIRDHAPTPPE